MSEAYNSIKQGLEDALAHANGKNIGTRVHMVEVPEPDVAAIRARPAAKQPKDKKWHSRKANITS